MPATTELITQKINLLKERISVERRAGRDTTDLESQFADLSSQLSVASTSLNESKNLLKG
jgi:hypothetical protein